MRDREAAIAKVPARFPRMSLCARHGKPARSRYRVIDRLYQLRDGERALALTRVALTLRPGAPISCASTASCWAIRSLAAICTVAGSCPAPEQAPRLMLHASELRFVHPVSHEPMHIQQASRSDRPRRESPGLPHQIVGHLKVGIRIVFILLILTQGAVQARCCWRRAGRFSRPPPPE